MTDERLFLPSASSFALDVACAGRQNLLRQMREQNVTLPDVDEEMSEYAARGQRIHEARRTSQTLNLSEEELDAYTKACAFERSLVENWMAENSLVHVSDPAQEERLWLNHPTTLAPAVSGQLDLCYLAGQYALIPDFKTGSAYYVGRANASWQLRIYALLAWKEWPQLKQIRVAFVKPEAFGGKVDYADFNEDSLAKVETKVWQVLWESSQPDAPLHAGPHCRFCPARANCPEAARYAMLPMLTTGANKGEMTKEIIEGLVELMPLDSAATVWRKKKIITTILDAIDTRLKALSDDELAKLGLKRKEGRKLDTVKDMVGAFNALRQAGFASEEILGCMTFSKGRAVEMLQRFNNASKAKAEAEYDKTLGQFIEPGRAKPSLVEV